MHELLPLGPFMLDRRVGRGGMAEVWAGRHEQSGREVAVKIVTAKPQLRERFHEAFRHEVRAAAGLDHPHVVPVYDHGEVPEGLSLPAGAPWLAMAFCGGGTLAETPPAHWTAARTALRAILEGLAHAHAHSVLHRDVKPGNILWGDGRWKLADFGISHTEGAPEVGGLGTPAYAAPEQLAGRFDEQGPWTDLFALGCTAWHLVCGAPPFGGTLAERRNNTRIPFRPRFAVPPELLPWLDGLLTGRPTERWRFAADALAGLDTFGEPIGGSDGAAGTPELFVSAFTQTPDATWFDGDIVDTGVHETVAAAVRPAPLPVAPLPEPHGGVSLLSDAGLGLIALRQPPLIGRSSERAAVWNELVAVATSGQPRLLALIGAQGIGKTRLVRWLCAHAHEAGAAAFVWASHAPGEEAGISGAIRAWFAPTASTPTLAAQIQRRWPTIDADEATALAQALHGEPMPAGSRHALFRRALDRAHDRTVIVVLDAAPNDPDALALARHLLESGERLLVVVTGRIETWAERPLEAQALDQLLADPAAVTLRLAPLSAVETAGLIRELLPIDGALAGQIAGVAHGNPAFAVEWVKLQASRGALVPGPLGFQLAGDAAVVLPDQRGPWRDIADRLELAVGDARSAALAAALGVHVAIDEWRRACGYAGIEPRLEALEQLIAWGLCESAPGGLSRGIVFGNAFLREALLERAGADLPRWHAACAEALADAPPERLAPHLLAAGQLTAGVRHLIDGAWRRYLEDDDLAALGMMREARLTLDRANNPADGIDRLTLAIQELQIRLSLGETATAVSAEVDTLAATAVLSTALQARLEVALATRAWFRSELSEATTHYEHAYRLSADGGDARIACQALRGLASLSRRRGELIAADTWALLAIERAKTLADPIPLVYALIDRINILLQRGDRTAAGLAAEQARAVTENYPWRTATGSVSMTLGELARLDGRWEQALVYYREARDFGRAHGGFARFYAELNIAFTCLRLGRWAEAREGVERHIDPRWLTNTPRAAIGASIVLAVATAGLGDLDAMAMHVDNATQLTDRTGEIERDYADFMQFAAELAGPCPGSDRALIYVAAQHARRQTPVKTPD